MTVTQTSKLRALFQSRKFWALITSLVGLAVATYDQTMPPGQAVLAAVAALSLYSVGTAIEDNGNTPPPTVTINHTGAPPTVTMTSGSVTTAALNQPPPKT